MVTTSTPTAGLVADPLDANSWRRGRSRPFGVVGAGHLVGGSRSEAFPVARVAVLVCCTAFGPSRHGPVQSRGLRVRCSAIRSVLSASVYAAPCGLQFEALPVRAGC